jgi:hypothetical protein
VFPQYGIRKDVKQMILFMNVQEWHAKLPMKAENKK